VTLTHEEDKLIVFERGDLLFIFNFHHTKVSVYIKMLTMLLIVIWALQDWHIVELGSLYYSWLWLARVRRFQ